MRKRDRHQLIKKMITEEKIKYTKRNSRSVGGAQCLCDADNLVS